LLKVREINFGGFTARSELFIDGSDSGDTQLLDDTRKPDFQAAHALAKHPDLVVAPFQD